MRAKVVPFSLRHVPSTAAEAVEHDAESSRRDAAMLGMPREAFEDIEANRVARLQQLARQQRARLELRRSLTTPRT